MSNLLKPVEIEVFIAAAAQNVGLEEVKLQFASSISLSHTHTL